MSDAKLCSNCGNQHEIVYQGLNTVEWGCVLCSILKETNQAPSARIEANMPSGTPAAPGYQSNAQGNQWTTLAELARTHLANSFELVFRTDPANVYTYVRYTGKGRHDITTSGSAIGKFVAYDSDEVRLYQRASVGQGSPLAGSTIQLGTVPCEYDDNWDSWDREYL